MPRLGLWLHGLAGRPGESYGSLLPRLWGAGRPERLPAQSSLEVAGRLLGFAGLLPAAALLAAADGLAPAGGWLLALEPVAIGGQTGRAMLQPTGLLPAKDNQALLAAAREHFADSPWQLESGARRWYLRSRSPLDLQTPDPETVWGQEAVQTPAQGADARSFLAFLNELQMLLAAHPRNLARNDQGLDSWCYFWPWGEGCLPAARPTSPWTHLIAAQEELQAAARWLGMAAEMPAAVAPDTALLWVWPGTWRDPATAESFDAQAGLLRPWRRRASIELYSGILAHGGEIERVRVSPASRWAFWRRALPGIAKRSGNW
ncbi:MAG: hypothetical protein U7M05_09060 [Candidatus Igneacidithiobacillus chanchocoensis]